MAMIPRDAMATIEQRAETKDFYAGLSDEEREAEDLPPAPGKKADAAPEEKKEAAAKDPGDEPPPDDDDDEPTTADDDAAADALFAEISNLEQSLTARLDRIEKKETGQEPPARSKDEQAIADALEHDDPVVRALAESLQDARKRMADMETAAAQARITAQEAQDDADLSAVQQGFLVDGKEMTDKQLERIENYMLKNPEVGRRVSFEDAAYLVFKGRLSPVPKSPSAKGPGGSLNSNQGKVATIIDEGGGGGAPAGNGNKPKPSGSIESGVRNAGRAFGWTR